MPSTIEKLPNEPIVILTLSEDYDWATEAAADDHEISALFDSLDQPVYYIMDTSAFNPDLSTIIQSTNQAARGEAPIFRHPNICGVIMVTQSDLKRLAAKGMDSDAFGHLDIKVFGTLEEALAHVRALA